MYHFFNVNFGHEISSFVHFFFFLLKLHIFLALIVLCRFSTTLVINLFFPLGQTNETVTGGSLDGSVRVSTHN